MGELYETGFRPGELTRTLFELKSRARLALERAVCDAMRYGAGGAVAVTSIPLSLRRETGAEEDDIDGVSSLLRSIEGIEAAALLKENGEGVWRVSMRSGAKIDVSALCADFGGGGHARAAGCTVTGTRREAEEQILAALERAYRAGA